MKWKIHLLTNVDFDKKHGDATAAITVMGERAIYFKPEYIDVSSVRHELFHAYCHELFLNSADLTLEQYEEVIAEFLGTYLPELNRKSNQIFQWLKKANT